jgi:hypothetical protein
MLTPAIMLNSSPEMWPAVPLPAEAKRTLPGLALAKAMNSGTVLAGNDGFTSMTLARRPMNAIGAMSRMKLKLSF